MAEKYYSNINLNTVFTPFKISQFLPLKNKVEKGLYYHLVYKFTCAGCNVCW